MATSAGAAVIEEGMGKSEAARMHREELRELGESLDSDVAPVLVEVEGEVARLTGSLETQYAGWRELLRKIFLSETGLPLNPNLQIVRQAPVSKSR